MTDPTKIRVVIIDDEEGSRRTLFNLLRDYCPEVEVVDMADGAPSGLLSIKKHQPELIFLDVRMPAGDEGFQLLDSLQDLQEKPAVVFTTSFDEYAIRAIKGAALDYLLKPINILELQKAVNRFRRRSAEDAADEQNGQQPTDNATASKIGLPSLEGITFVDISEVIRCEADGNCTIFHLKAGKRMMVTKTLKYYDELLSEHDFYRVHGSHLVNMRHIHKYLKEGTVLMSDGSHVYVSARKKKAFVDTLQEQQYKI